MRAPNTPYRAPRWLRGGHSQTLYAVLRRGAMPAYTRERWDTPDGDFIDIDWALPRDCDDGAPLVMLFHGLEGNSTSHYARRLMNHVAATGWSGAVVHFRGCSGSPNRLARAYHSGDSPEADWILRRLRDRYPTRRLFAVGVSLGGNVLLKWLGEQGAAARMIVDAAAAVSAPVDLAAAGEQLQHGFNIVYTRNFLHTLKRSALAKLKHHPGLYDASRVLAARNLREFDDVVTAPLHGFRDADDYWRRASSKPWLAGIAVPTLLLNSLNDPFLPASALPSAQQVSSKIEIEFPREGGHVGFVSGAFPGHIDWLPQHLLRFFKAQFGEIMR